MKRIEEQAFLKGVSISRGRGAVRRSQHGAFIVFSRISFTDLLNEIQKVNPEIKFLMQMKTVFLLGPTPVFYGNERAETSWRRDFVDYIDQMPQFDSSYMVVIPEPLDCNWSSVDYDPFPEMPHLEEKMRHIHVQIHWENWFIDMALENGIVCLHAYLRWDGNAGPTVRLEAGKLLDRLSRNEVNCCVINLPQDSQSVQYIEAHLLDASHLFHKGRFALTECSPMSGEKDALRPFFAAIGEMATLLNDK